MSRWLTAALTIGVLLGGTAGLVRADEEKKRTHAKKRQPIFVSTETLLGCKVKQAGVFDDTISDALIDAESGQVTAFVLESGQLAEFDRVEWSPKNKRFDFAHTLSEEGSEGSSDDRPSACFLLSKVLGYSLMGVERSEKGRNRVELGSLGGLFIDTRSGHATFVTTSIGGVLGIGAESRVIPWSAIDIGRLPNGDFCLNTSINRKRLDRAPAYGDGPDNLNNPEYRDTLYSYYGTDRGDFEPETSEATSIVTLDRIVGAPIDRPGNNKETLQDLILSPESGQVAYALSSAGTVFPIEALKWDWTEKRFRVQDRDKGIAEMPKGSQLLATALVDFDVVCNGKPCGDLETLYFDTSKGKLSYVSVDVDAVRVLPWSAVAVPAKASAKRVEIKVSESALRTAPELDGEVGATIYSPAFRERLKKLEKKTDSSK